MDIIIAKVFVTMIKVLPNISIVILFLNSFLCLYRKKSLSINSATPLFKAVDVSKGTCPIFLSVLFILSPFLCQKYLVVQSNQNI